MKEIKVFDYADKIMNQLQEGVLLTTKSGDKVNTMTISWGMLGIEWGKQIFTTLVRENRFTRTQLDENSEFTVNIPYGEFEKKILGFCGTKSGRTVDKIKEMNLDLVEGECVSVPAIRQCPITLECKVIYKQKLDSEALPEEIRTRDYPQDVDSSSPLANKDYHILYHGEIVKAYILE